MKNEDNGQTAAFKYLKFYLHEFHEVKLNLCNHLSKSKDSNEQQMSQFYQRNVKPVNQYGV